MHALTNFSSVSYSIEPSIEISTPDDLGKQSVSGFEKVIALHESMESPFNKRARSMALTRFDQNLDNLKIG